MAQGVGRGLLTRVETPGLPDSDTAQVVGAGFVADADGPSVSAGPPRHGEHTREALAELGFAAAEVEALLAAGAVCEARS